MKLTLFAPELVLLLGGLLLFFMSTGKTSGRTARLVTLAIAAASALAAVSGLGLDGTLFYQAYKVDLFSQGVKFLIGAGFAAVLLAGSELKGVAEDMRPEYYLFMTLSVLGLFLMVSSVELLTMFVALELSSYSLYLLVPMRGDQGGLRMQMESAVKYILFGVAATGVMLFGMSYMFGLTGTTYFDQLMPALRAMGGSPAAVVAVAMVLGGFFFKLAAFPFHFWVPDVYQGASNETAAFIASVPKVGAVALLVRIAAMASPGDQVLSNMLMAFAILSMFYGNLVALVQTDLKRMLGFSGIAHAGYVLVGFVALRDTGYATALYYITGYLLMTISAFLVVCTVSGEGGNLKISDLGGLYKRAPLLAFVMAVSMFALAGIPPFVGFMGKFLLLAGAWKAGFTWLVILAAINTAISIYYYLSVVRVVYTVSPEEKPHVMTGGPASALGVVLVAAIVALGLAPDAIIKMALAAVRSVM
ncbi:MAG: NADH-quinone oxidoreductase subunit N [Thermodesulfobacteriota bacterium]